MSEEKNKLDFDISKMQNLILSDAFSDYRIDVLNSEISLGYTLNPNFLSDLKEIWHK